MSAFKSNKKTPGSPFIPSGKIYDNFLGIGEGRRAEAKANAEIEKARIAAEAATQLNNIEIARQQGEQRAKDAAALAAAQAAAAKAAAGMPTSTILMYVGAGIVVLFVVLYFFKKKK